jgi:hypothetical protein
MIRDDQDRLLNEILAGDELEQFRRASENQMLNAVKRSRRQRRATRIIALCSLPLLAALALVVTHHTASTRTASNHPQTPPQTATVSQNPSVQTIDDEQLFALFPDRPMALVGPPGHQQLVFLDQPKPPPSGRPM